MIDAMCIILASYKQRKVESINASLGSGGRQLDKNIKWYLHYCAEKGVIGRVRDVCTECFEN